ncbi:MAG: EfeM/EfeO family lipoprotein, partial [Actinomycetota bacterium]|nr:EfeM/EfeO family lipoprotein [Actinomycetota bacterium]
SGTASSGTAASGTAASGSESATGITVDTSVTVDDPLVEEAAMQYTEYVRGQTDLIVSDAKVFTDAVRANDIDAAKAAYAPSRQAWERIEPIAGLVEDIDVAVDARVDDFESEDDPAWTGWHKLEYLVYDVGDIGPESGATELADQLDADLATLQETMASTDIPAAAIPVGASELIEEVSGGKLTGEEDRYSGTDLWDIAANLEGSEAAFETLEGAVEAKDPELVERIEAGFEDADDLIEKYEDGEGYQPFDELTEADSDAFKTTLGALAEDLALVAGVLGLE